VQGVAARSIRRYRRALATPCRVHLHPERARCRRWRLQPLRRPERGRRIHRRPEAGIRQSERRACNG